MAANNSFGTGVRLNKTPNRENFCGIFLGGLQETMGPGPYTASQIQETWGNYFGLPSNSGNFSDLPPSNSYSSSSVEIIENYGTKNSAVFGLPKDKEIIKAMKELSPSSKYGKLKDDRYGYLFPKSDLDAVKEYFAQKNIYFHLASSKKEESNSTPSRSGPSKSNPHTIEIARANSHGNRCIKGTNYVVAIPSSGVVILVGMQDENSDKTGFDSVIKLSEQVKEEYKVYKKLIVLDEDNVSSLCEQYRQYKDYFMRIVYDQSEEDEDE